MIAPPDNRPAASLPAGRPPARPTDDHPAAPTRAQHAAALAIVLLLALGWFAATAASHVSGPWDNVEQLVWTQALQWGYYKHPPLPTWMLAAATLPFGPVIQVTWAMGVACVAIGLWLTWRLGCDLIGPRRATVGLLLSTAVAYYSVRALYYNHNLAMLPFVSAAALLLHRALRDGRARQWAGFGLMVGLGALCKYQTAIFLACWVAAALACARRGRRPGRLGPVAGLALAAGCAAAVIAPHAAWLVANAFPPFRYAGEQLGAVSGATGWVSNLAGFLGVQLARCVAVALAMAAIAWRLGRLARSAPAPDPIDFAPPAAGRAWLFLLLVGLGPIALTLALGLAGVHLETHWGTPELLALGLLAAARWPAAGSPRAIAAAAAVVAGLQVLMAAGFAIGRGAWPHLSGVLARSTYPARAVSEAIDAQWRARTRAPLVLVAGETWEAGAVALNLARRARVLIDADPARSPGVDAAALARCGAMVVWDTSREPELPEGVRRLRAAGTVRGTVSVGWSGAARARPIVLGWSMIEPPSGPSMPGSPAGSPACGPASRPDGPPDPD